MRPNDYQKLAMRTEADQEAILQRLVGLGPQAMRLDNAARGLAGDAGEVSSAVMKYIEYGRQLDRTNLLEEVGDCFWRLAQVCEAAGFTIEEAMQANLRKLAVRYPDKYTDEASAQRDREKERLAVERHTAADTLTALLREDYTFADKTCEVCGQPASRIVHDTSRDSRVEESHCLCRDHDRPAKILPNPPKAKDPKWDDPDTPPADRSGS